MRKPFHKGTPGTIFILAIMLTALSAWTSGLEGAVIFSDTFTLPEGSADALWNNEFPFLVQSGAYDAVYPTNNPLAITTIKNLAVTDAVVDMDILGSTDGGVVLHSQAMNPNNGNIDGILLVVKPNSHQLYWHVLRNGSNWDLYNLVPLSANAGDNLHVSIEIVGTLFTAQVYRLSDNTLVGETYLDNGLYPSGGIGIYDFGTAQRFDNVVVSMIPEPAALALLALGGFFLRRKG